jgi:hypothetical protein
LLDQLERHHGHRDSLSLPSCSSGLIPIVRLSPPGVAAVGPGGDPDLSRSVDSPSLFREAGARRQRWYST